MNKPKFTGHIRIIGHGVGADGQKFVKLEIAGSQGNVKALIRIDNWNEDTECAKLNRLGAHLISDNAKRELTNRIQSEGPTKPGFPVATKTGFMGDAFALPDRVISVAKSSKIETYFDDIPLDIIAKYKCAGTLKGWKKLVRYSKGNSRMMFAFALNFVGPVSGIMPLEFVSGQFCGAGGQGKTTVGAVASSVWGWNPDPVLGNRFGFGDSWNNTVNNLERIFASYNQTIMFLDETRAASNQMGKRAQELLDDIIKIDLSIGRGRLNENEVRRSWFSPLLSTSNISVPELLKLAGLEFDASYIDRLPDIPLPEGGHGIFENLHGFSDVAAFSIEWKKLAAKNHGHAGRVFVRQLLKATKRDHKGLVAWIEKRRARYLSRAKKQIIAEGRDLTRVHGKFATVYAIGRLAAKFKVLPFNWKDLLAAILKCEADHVTFIAKSATTPLQAASDPFNLLLAYIRSNRHRFRDLQKPVSDPLAGDKKLDYSAITRGKAEFLFDESTFERIVGGKGAATKLKNQLDGLGLIDKTRAGKQGARWMVHRKIDGKRPWVVAIDARILDTNPLTT